MALPFDLVTIAYGKLSEAGAMLWRAYNELTGPDDVEDFGELPVYQALGVTSRPFPADDDGRATGVVLRGAGNELGVLFGGRDTRCSGIYGALKDGDSCLHATGPGAVAQVQVKHNKQVVLFTKDQDDEGMILVLDGKNNKLQLSYAGAVLEIDKAAGHTLLTSPTGGASIQLLGDDVVINGGNIFLGDPNAAKNQVASAPQPAMGALFASAPPYPGGIVGGARVWVAPL
jgi:hypothetical protein